MLDCINLRKKRVFGSVRPHSARLSHSRAARKGALPVAGRARRIGGGASRSRSRRRRQRDRGWRRPPGRRPWRRPLGGGRRRPAAFGAAGRAQAHPDALAAGRWPGGGRRREKSRRVAAFRAPQSFAQGADAHRDAFAALAAARRPGGWRRRESVRRPVARRALAVQDDRGASA